MPWKTIGFWMATAAAMAFGLGCGPRGISLTVGILGCTLITIETLHGWLTEG